MRGIINILSATFVIAYVFFSFSGFLLPEITNPLILIYKLPVIVCVSTLYVLFVIVRLRQNRWRKGLNALLFLAVSTMFLGIWAGYLYSYHFDVVITEGQTISTENIKVLPESEYSGLFAQKPRFSVKLRQLLPEMDSSGNALRSVKGLFSVSAGVKGPEREMEIGGTIPRHIGGGTMASVSRLGYSPLFTLMDDQGKTLDSLFVYLDMFPPGKEDFFRLLSPHTFYIKYFPTREKSTLNIRIARNKALLVNRKIALGEEVVFDNGRITVIEVRQWTVLSIFRDPGIPLIMAGLVLLAVTALAGLRRHLQVRPRALK